jgi:hypothetical protein
MKKITRIYTYNCIPYGLDYKRRKNIVAIDVDFEEGLEFQWGGYSCISFCSKGFDFELSRSKGAQRDD